MKSFMKSHMMIQISFKIKFIDDLLKNNQCFGWF